MGADNLAENTPNAPEFICPIFLSSGFQWKKSSLGIRSPFPIRVQYNYLVEVQSKFEGL
jgi:hypothetical protein